MRKLDPRAKVENMVLRFSGQLSPEIPLPSIRARLPFLNWFLAPRDPILTLVMSAKEIIQYLDQGSGYQKGHLSAEVIPGASD